ncbi:hypothetical protein EGW08_017138 [Elysia chlorotica]|uniref:Uncharacterized protein n=1 Tax=Elysia chlorotica TaxID=188477 RepID=A0A433T0S1_ELYCH|nr:hypothetical protein EGW08_017138 [Elysia chlorotica]
MDFLQACKEAEASGTSRQQFLKVWEQEAKMKQTEKELKLQKMRTEAQSSGTGGDAPMVTNMVEAQLQKFSIEQRRVLGNLREELQQQNQALIGDISRLLEGFASMVGRVVKEELEVAVSQLSSSHVPQKPKITEQKSTRTWSKVHQEESASQELSSTEGEIPLKGQSKKSGKMQTQKALAKQQQGNSASIKSQPITSSANKQGKKATPNQQHGTSESAKSQPIKKSVSKQQVRNGLPTSEVPKLFTLGDSIRNEDVMSSSVHFFPEDGPANMLIFDIQRVAQSGKVSKSPVYYLQDCPCKVQLCLWFDAEKKMNMRATLWGLAPEPLSAPRLFTFNGRIKNKASQSYSSLFCSESSAFKMKNGSNLSVKLEPSLKTGTGVYSMNLGELVKRRYILENRNSISINWTVSSKEDP